MVRPWTVDFYEGESGRAILLDEIRDLLTNTQLARFRKRIERLELYGPALDADYFDNVAGSTVGLKEFRVRLEKVAFPVLFSLEPERTYVMLVAYKEQSGGIPKANVETAENRLLEWRRRKL